MYVVPVLPDEATAKLDDFKLNGKTLCALPGVVAVFRPLGVEDTAAWDDAFPDPRKDRNVATVELVRRQLLRLDGLTMQAKDATGATADVAFDVTNAAHFRSLPEDVVFACYLAIRGRAEVTGDTEKNFGSPSGSDGMTTGGNSRAETVTPAPATA